MAQSGSGTVGMLVIDMQVGSFAPPAGPHDAARVVDRINALAAGLRGADGLVVFVQHDGPEGDPFAPGAPGWALLPELERASDDALVRKQACDAFYETELAALLERRGVRELVVTGSATDFCVDTTVRAAASRDFAVVAARDAHTTRDRPHLDAASIIRHHNAVWEDLILPRRRVEVLPTAEILGRLGDADG